jgi:hypothetical protein
MVGVSQKSEMCPVYMMSITLGMSDGAVPVPVTFAAEVIGMPSPPVPQQHVGLLGRDFLSHFRFTYDGPSGSFEIDSGQRPPPAKRPHGLGDKAAKKAKRDAQKRARRKSRR